MGRGKDYCLFDTRSGKELASLPHLPYVVNVADVDPDGLLLYAGFSEVRLRQPTGAFVVPADVDRHSRAAKGIALLERPGQDPAVVVAADSFCLFGLDGKLLSRFGSAVETGAGDDVCVSSNGGFVAGREGSKLRVWSTSTGKVVGELDDAIDGRPVAVTDDGRTVLTAGIWGIAEMLAIWDFKQGKVTTRTSWGEDDSLDVGGCFLEGLVLALGEGGVLVWVDPKTGAVEKVAKEGTPAQALCPIPSNQGVLAAGTEFWAATLHAQSGKVIQLLKGPSGDGEDEGYYAVAASASGVMAVGGTDETVRLYRAGETKAFASLRMKSAVTALGFDRLGRYLGVGTWDGKVQVWRLL